MTAPRFKPNDIVRTPSGRTARVHELRPDGKLDLVYIDGSRDEVALDADRLFLIAAAPICPWKTRTP